jgi:hypothetical protein
MAPLSEHWGTPAVQNVMFVTCVRVLSKETRWRVFVGGDDVAVCISMTSVIFTSFRVLFDEKCKCKFVPELDCRGEEFMKILDSHRTTFVVQWSEFLTANSQVPGSIPVATTFSA